MDGRIEEAAFNDHDAIRGLLEAAGLPVPGADDAPVRMLVARERGRVVACIGHERHGESALLRSLAVSLEGRRRGTGRALVEALCARLDAREVYLLTIEAAPFFAKLGFERVERTSVPDALRASRQFVIHRCDSAVVMRRRLA